MKRFLTSLIALPFLSVPAAADAMRLSADVLTICTDPQPEYATTIKAFKSAGWRKLVTEDIDYAARLSGQSILLGEFHRAPLPSASFTGQEFLNSLIAREAKYLPLIVGLPDDTPARRHVMIPPDHAPGALLITSNAPSDLFCSYRAIGDATDISNWGEERWLPSGKVAQNTDLVTVLYRASAYDEADPSLYSARVTLTIPHRDIILEKARVDIELSFDLQIESFRLPPDQIGDPE